MSCMNAKILETFHSIQGEGKYAGVAQVFVRFFECNMHCTWCDTPHSIGDTTRHYKEYALEQLFQETQELWQDCHSVSLTGGEPLVQSEFLKEFLPLLHEADFPTYLDTNGTLPQALSDVIEHLDIIAMDIKLPSSTKCRPYWDEHEQFLKIAQEKDIFIKTVISKDTDLADIKRAVALVDKIAPETLFILQPNYFEMNDGVVAKCQEFQNYCSKILDDVRILPQTHKFMKLR